MKNFEVLCISRVFSVILHFNNFKGLLLKFIFKTAFENLIRYIYYIFWNFEYYSFHLEFLLYFSCHFQLEAKTKSFSL